MKAAAWRGARVLVLAIMLAGSIAACATKSSIRQVISDPGSYHDKTVKIVGNVTESVGLLGYGLFKLDDGTGALWVLSRRGLPRPGAQVVVKGSVRDIGVFGVKTADGWGLIPASVADSLRSGVLMIEADRTAQ
jgi:hypothetical protein